MYITLCWDGLYVLALQIDVPFYFNSRTFLWYDASMKKTITNRMIENACHVLDGYGVELDDDMLEAVYKEQEGLFIHLLRERERKWITFEAAQTIWIMMNQ
jgi:hypothetical protein